MIMIMGGEGWMGLSGSIRACDSHNIIGNATTLTSHTLFLVHVQVLRPGGMTGWPSFIEF